MASITAAARRVKDELSSQLSEAWVRQACAASRHVWRDRVDPAQFERWITQWTAHLAKCTQGRVLVIDGKTLRRSFQAVGKKGAIHMINAWCASNHLVLGQLATDQKSNEIRPIVLLRRSAIIRFIPVSMNHAGRITVPAAAENRR